LRHDKTDAADDNDDDGDNSDHTEDDIDNRRDSVEETFAFLLDGEITLSDAVNAGDFCLGVTKVTAVSIKTAAMIVLYFIITSFG